MLRCMRLIAGFLVLSIVSGFPSREKGYYVSVHELDSTTSRRTMGSSPDTLSLALRSNDLDEVVLNLHRDDSMDLSRVTVVRMDDQGETESDENLEDSLLFQDWERNAAILLNKGQDSRQKKHVLGTFLHDGRAYEIKPVSGDDEDPEIRNMIRTMDPSDFQLHVVSRSSFYRPAIRESDAEVEDSVQETVDDLLNRDEKAPELQGLSEQLLGLLRTHSDREAQGDPLSPPTEEEAQGQAKVTKRSSGAKPGPNHERSEEGHATLDRLLRELRNLRGLSGNLAELNGKLGDLERVARGFSGKKGVSMTTTDFNVEVGFILDETIYDFFKTNFGTSAVQQMKYYLSHIFNGINMAFRRISKNNDGISIRIWFKKLVYYTTSSQTAFIRNNAIDSSTGGLIAQTAGKNFGTWASETEGYKWHQMDHLILWTKRKLVDYEADTNKVINIVGQSSNCRLCSAKYSWSLVKLDGPFAWTTAVHEIAHNMGAFHDDGTYGCQPSEKFLMSTSSLSLESSTLANSFKLSSCSVNQMSDCLSGRRDNVPKICSMDPVCSNSQALEQITKLPGESYSLDKQCQMSFGTGYTFKSSCYTQYWKICRALTCHDGSRCKTHSNKELRAADGTSCGSGKWCLNGNCVNVNRNSYFKSSGVNCGTMDTTVSSCPADRSNQCQNYVNVDPYQYFKHAVLREYCPTTAKKYGLYLATNDPCVCPKLLQFHCKKNGQDVCLDWNKMCDFGDDCDGGSDEQTDFCISQSLNTPYCGEGKFLSYLQLSREKTNICVSLDKACDGQKSMIYNTDNAPGMMTEDPDENTNWCKKLPMKACRPGTRRPANNPSICV